MAGFHLPIAGWFCVPTDNTWLLARPSGIANWKGEAPVRLAEGRSFVVLGVVYDGQFATFDAETFELVPLRVDSAGPL